MLAVQSTSPVHQQYRNAGSSATTHATGDKPKAPKLRHLRKPSTSPQLTQVCSFSIVSNIQGLYVNKDKGFTTYFGILICFLNRLLCNGRFEKASDESLNPIKCLFCWGTAGGVVIPRSQATRFLKRLPVKTPRSDWVIDSHLEE